MKEKITIHDIAHILGVSPSTVSRALNGNQRISASTRNKVIKLAKKFDYKPNNLASSLRIGKSNTIGVIVPRINRHFFSNIIGGMEEILNNAGYNLVICQSHEDYQKEVDNIKSLIKLRVDAVFISLSASTKSSEHIQELIDQGTRVIMFDRVDEQIKTSKVILNDYKGAFSTVEHMIEQGFKNIFHFSGPQNIAVYTQRQKGYEDALAKHNISSNPDMIFSDVITKEKGMEVFHEICQQQNRPDAIFSSSDLSALGVLLNARKRNLKIPYNIGIAGFSNEPFTEFVQPGITSVDQNAHLMGEKVAEIYLDDKNENNLITEIIEPILIKRKSTLRNA